MYADFAPQYHPTPPWLTRSCSSRIQKQADAGTRFSILVPAVAEVAFLVALGHGALKSSASSAAIGTQWCVSEVGILS